MTRSLRSLGLAELTARALERAGYTTARELVDAPDAELLLVPRIGRGRLAEIRRALAALPAEPPPAWAVLDRQLRERIAVATLEADPREALVEALLVWADALEQRDDGRARWVRAGIDLAAREHGERWGSIEYRAGTAWPVAEVAFVAAAPPPFGVYAATRAHRPAAGVVVVGPVGGDPSSIVVRVGDPARSQARSLRGDPL